MLRTSSGDRPGFGVEASEPLAGAGVAAAAAVRAATIPGGRFAHGPLRGRPAGVAAAAAVRAATIPGARFALGTLRGRPALVVWTEAAWSVAGAAASGADPGVRVAP